MSSFFFHETIFCIFLSKNNNNRFIQCEVNSTKLSVILRSYQNAPLTAQDVYDLRDSIRKSNKFIDYADEDDYYIINDEIEFSNSYLIPPELTTSTLDRFKSSSPSSAKLHFKFVYLLLFFLTQTIQ